MRAILLLLLSFNSKAFIEPNYSPYVDENDFFKADIIRVENEIILKDGKPYKRIFKEIHNDSPLHFTKSIFLLSTNQLLEKEIYQDILGDLKLITKYQFNDDLELIAINNYNSFDQIESKNMSSPLSNESVRIEYSYESETDRNAFGFKVYDKETGTLIHNYNRGYSFNPESIYSDQEKVKNLYKENRLKIAIVDSGLDQNHPDLANKLSVNFNDPIDGIDNDGNGLVDDFIGWQYPLRKGFPLESILPKKEVYPLSHGTHVSGIMVDGIDNVQLFPLVGEYGEPDYLNFMKNYILENEILMVNMSFSLPHWMMQQIPKKTFYNLRNLIRRNSETVFFAAAGNDYGKMINNGKYGLFPAGFALDNVFSIGALNTDQFREEDILKYKVADFSNIGPIFVDIFAPGTDVLAASLGGGKIAHSGTSMASPWTLNMAIKIKDKYPSLTPLEIKSIIMYSAYIPDINNPLPCLSGGMVFPRRANELAKRFSKDKTQELESLALQLRSESEFIIGSEIFNKEKLLKRWSLF